ncbi:hypothetical protein BSNK01_09260 [Bacillaceae bacterium]
MAGIDYSVALFADPLLADAFGYASTETSVLFVFGIVLLLHGIMNHVGIRTVARLNDFSAWYHIAVVAILIFSLAFFAKGGLQPIGYLFQVGQTFSDKPYMLAFVTFSIHDVAGAAAAENAFIYVISQALGGTFGYGVLWLVTLAMWFCGLSSITSFSRMMYAFSRDDGMPLSRHWAQISRKYRTPAKAIWLSVVLSSALALLDYIIKSINPNTVYTTLTFLTAVSVVGLYVAYGIPIYLKLRAESRGIFQAKHLGPWNLGRWSRPINFISLLWIIFISIIMVIPPNQNAAYALVGMFLLLLIMDFAYYKHHFEGPEAAMKKSLQEIMEKEKEFESYAAPQPPTKLGM